MTDNQNPAHQTNVDAVTAALARLAEHGVPVDIQEVLVHGNVSLGVPPGALAAALSATPSPAPQMTGLPRDVVNLVIAAREFWDANNDLTPESRALDEALSAFSDRVPYENQPEEDGDNG